jgi:hypothetical protein
MSQVCSVGQGARREVVHTLKLPGVPLVSAAGATQYNGACGCRRSGRSRKSGRQRRLDAAGPFADLHVGRHAQLSPRIVSLLCYLSRTPRKKLRFVMSFNSLISSSPSGLSANQACACAVMAVACLEDPAQPSPGEGCDNCRYFNDRLRLGQGGAGS